MKVVRVKMVGWGNPNLRDVNGDNFFYHVLRKKYELHIVNEDPDLIFYELGDTNPHLRYNNCVKIYYAGEPGIWDKNRYMPYYKDHPRIALSMKDANYVISTYNINNPTHFRLPLYVLYAYQMTIDKRIPNLNYFTKAKNFTKDNISNRKCCVFMHRNKHGKRSEFKNKLMKYINVDDVSIGGYSYEKHFFIKNYKFTFAFENNDGYIGDVFMGDNYTTEKIIEPMAAGSVSLYWGNKDIAKELNTKSFMNWYDYNDDDSYIEKIIELNNNDDLYLEMLNQPNVIDYENSPFNEEKMLAFFEKILD